MDYHVHVGGMSALGLQGYRHYLPLGAHPPVWLYGSDTPTWLSRLTLDAPLISRPLSLFNDPSLGLTEYKNGNAPTLPWGWTLRISSPERAILEALDELPAHESFHNLDMVLEGLATMRPRQLAALLQSCRKIKVRRLFFVFADRHTAAAAGKKQWAVYLGDVFDDTTRVDLEIGHGNHVLGEFHAHQEATPLLFRPDESAT